jgi:cytoplasmic iron level regulating protein YaaA (DUF328/UPF0246 family)
LVGVLVSAKRFDISNGAQMEGDIQTLMVRARQDLLVDASTFPAAALAELRQISDELQAQKAAAATFHQHQVRVLRCACRFTSLP